MEIFEKLEKYEEEANKKINSESKKISAFIWEYLFDNYPFLEEVVVGINVIKINCNDVEVLYESENSIQVKSKGIIDLGFINELCRDIKKAVKKYEEENYEIK